MNNVKAFEQLGDLELVERISAGEIGLFEILIRRNNPFLYKIGRVYGYNHEDTEDLMQETFVSAYFNLAQFEKRSSFKTWILKIMVNNCFHKRRKFSFKNEIVTTIHEKSIPVYSNQHHNDTAKTVMNRELNHVIENSLGGLPEQYRMVFSLREISGLNVSETAHVLAISESNVKIRLKRAKAMLRKEIEKSYSAQEIYEFNLVYCDAMVNRVFEKIT